MDEADSEIEAKLREVLGERFGTTVSSDRTWAREVLGMTGNNT
jgi:transcription initiation factor TFIID subunit 6